MTSAAPTSSPWHSRDRLARVLHTMRMRGTFYCHADLTSPWALTMPSITDSVSFHVVTTGGCVLRVPDGADLRLRAGDLALVPHGLGHDLLSDGSAGPSVRVDRLPQTFLSPHYSVLEHGGGGRETELICGVVSFDEPAARELVHRLPRILLLGGDTAWAGGPIRDTLRLMAAELARPQPGGEAIATRLADILVVQAIRAWLEHDPDARQGWLQALQDDRIGKALAAIHADPGADWTLASLARAATMSRSAFSARFSDLVGEAPIGYLTRWRMNLARTRLLEHEVTVSQVAAEFGYQSEAAFNRAFSRIVGQTPGSVRRRPAG